MKRGMALLLENNVIWWIMRAIEINSKVLQS